jgi:sugar lactone lactonase YvrE
MRRAVALGAALLALAPLVAAPAASARDRWDTRVFALVPRPGFPAMAYVAPSGRVYEGTYDNPTGDTMPSRVLEYDGEGTLLRSWTLNGQDIAQAHGVQVATSDSAGRLVLLDKAPPRIVLLDPRTGSQTTEATFPAGSIPNYADGGPFGTTGIALAPDRSTLIIGQQSEAGLGAGNPSTGRLLTVAIGRDGKPGGLTPLWESRPADGPDGFAIARSGAIYVALLVANQIAVVGPDGSERERFPAGPGGANGSAVPFDNPSSVRFLGTRLMVANQSYIAGDATHQAILDVEAGEPGLPELIPPPVQGSSAPIANHHRRAAKRKPRRRHHRARRHAHKRRR